MNRIIISTRFFIMMAGLTIGFNHLSFAQCVPDLTPPVMLDCAPLDQTVYRTNPGNCGFPNPITTASFNEDRTAICILQHQATIPFYQFLMGPGGGTLPTPIYFGTDSFAISGINNGIPGQNSQNNYCFFVTCDGSIEFNYTSVMSNGDDFPNDRARVMILNNVYGTNTTNVLTLGPGSSTFGFQRIPVRRGDRVCFEVNSDNTLGVNTLVIKDLTLIGNGTLSPHNIGPVSEEFLYCGISLAAQYVVNCAGYVQACFNQVEVIDTISPTYVNCPQNFNIQLPSHLCDTALTWPIPTIINNCTYPPDFTGAFAPGQWLNNLFEPFVSYFSGFGTDALITHNATTLEITGSNNGVPGILQTTVVTKSIPCNGTVKFNWDASMPGGGFLNDEFGYGVGVNLFNLSVPPGATQANGSECITVTANQTFTFFVNSDNRAFENTVTISNFQFIPDPVVVSQLSGPTPGTPLPVGKYRVVYGSNDCCGENTCEFDINITATSTMVCKNINVSLDYNCEALITPEMLLVGVCPERSIVRLSHYNHAIDNPVDSHFLDKTIIGTVIDTVTGNSCWSYIKIEDKLAPEIFCQDITVSCFEFELLEDPFVVEECSNYKVVKLEERVEKLHCNEEYVKLVSRRYISIDSRGNVSDTCNQLTWVERYDFENVWCPSNIRIYCSDSIMTDENGHPSPYVTGVPYYHDGEIDIVRHRTSFPMWPTTDFLCNLLVDYEDIDLGEINCVRKIMRNWRFREWWCNDEIERFCPTQIIEIIDDIGPEILHAPYDFHATTGHRKCDARVLLPSIEAKDICHNDLVIDITYPGGFLKDQNGGYVNLPVGDDTIIYRIYDACYNLTTDTLIVHVKDETEPVAVCDRRTVVALNQSGYNWVPAEVFDDGSFDECYLHHFEVRRMDDNACGTTGPDDWGPEVGFCCEDIDKFLMVGFKAIDKAGNEAICMVQVVVQDKVPPHVHCPPHIQIDCRYPIDYNHMDEFGIVALQETDRGKIVLDPNYWWNIQGHPQDGIAIDNCPPTILHEVNLDSINQCGMGFVKRKFVAVDLFGNRDSCYQHVYVDNHYDFNEDSIIWPVDFDTATCLVNALNPDVLPAPYNKPRFLGNDCSLVGTSYHDHVFSASLPGDPCFKIIRVWKVIDWCQFNRYGDFVTWVDTQYIKVYNFDDPVIRSGIRDTAICSYELDCRPIPIRLPITANDLCTPTSEILFRHKIDYNSDGTIDFERAGLGENILQGTHPLGRHIVKWEVEDRCGNTAKAQFVLNLLNCKAPTAYCINGLSTSLTPMDLNGDGIPDAAMDTVWAKDFDAGSNHNCYNYVALSFSRDTNDKSIIFDCNRRGLQRVELWVTDQNGNTSFCRTFIDVQDNSGFCPPTFNTSSISGTIATEADGRVELVKVLKGNDAIMTDFDGQYSFSDLPQGSAYIFRPEKNNDWLNGITTGDIIRIQRHILGQQTFDSPFKFIAADVNRSGNVTARDMSDLRKLILGVNTEIAGNTSWRFVQAMYNFTNPSDPLAENFPEQYEINSLVSDMELDFYAIKTGDVNLDAKTRGSQTIKSRQASDVVLVLEDLPFQLQEEVIIPVRISNGNTIVGLQGALSWNPNEMMVLDVIGNQSIGVGYENFNMHHLQEGRLAYSWNGDLNDGDILFNLKVKILSITALRTVKLLPDWTENVAVMKSGLEDRQLSLELRKSAEEDFVVYPNVPNPWKDETRLRMHLPMAGNVQLSIYDATGKMFYQGSKYLAKGDQSWHIPKGMLDHSGVYYYQLDFENKTLTQKMLKTE